MENKSIIENTQRRCENCEIDLPTKPYNVKICSDRCRQDIKNKKTLEKTPDAVTCKLCGLVSINLTTHLSRIHNLKKEEYIKQYDSPAMSESYQKSLSLKIAGKNNPGYQHGGKLSSWSKKSVHYSDESVEKAKENRKGKRSSDFEYWLNKCNGDEAEAKKLYKERQTTNGLDFYIKKYGEDSGPEKFKARIKQWQENYTKSNFSKVSQKLFWKLEDDYFGNTFFAEKGEKINNEFILELKISYCKPDYICLDSKKVIEFDGDYWHSRQENITRDKQRDNYIIEAGYEILHVKEFDFNLNPEKVIKECLLFLKGNNA